MSFKSFLFVFFVIVVVSARHHLGREEQEMSPSDHDYKKSFSQYRAGRLSAPASYSTGPIFFPVDYGADPTGKEDSYEAFAKIITELLTFCKNFSMADSIHDCGGATIDLQGGQYLLSKPLSFPQMYGNFKMMSGTLRAMDSFPTDKYLVSVGAKSCSNKQQSCNEHVSFSYMDFDANVVAKGGLYIGATMGCNVGPYVFFIGYTYAGVYIDGGHETMVHQGWFGEYYYENGPKNTTTATGTGVIINGNDHYLVDDIFFWSKNGVEINGGANLLRGVHTWCGGDGIIVNGGANRLLNCYIDWNTLLVKKFENNLILDTFFYVAHAVFKPSGKQDVTGFAFERSLFGGSSGTAIEVDLSEGSFGTIRDCYITEQFEGAHKYTIKQTQLTKSLHLKDASEFTIDFKDNLVFGRIASYHYSVIVEDDKFVRYYGKPVNGTAVTVVTEEPITGTVTISVDESTYAYQQ